MKRQERDEWVAALRSGEFKQTRGVLDEGGKQCCLGVKCILDVRAQRHGITRVLDTVTNPETGVSREVTKYGVATLQGFFQSSMMPVSSILAAWGLSNGISSKLAELNDDTGMSFAEIADWIEENVEVEDEA